MTLFDSAALVLLRVYVAALDEDRSIIKIGVSRHPDQRVADLGMVLLFDLPGDESYEAWIHQQLRAYRAWGRRCPHPGATEEYGMWWEPVQVMVLRLRRQAVEYVVDDSAEWARAQRLWDWAPPAVSIAEADG